MGDKIEAKRTVKRLGIPTVPGSDGAIASDEQAQKVARDIGFPVLVKAAAGGGGRGMRLVNAPDELADAYAQASNEAMAAFSDGTLYVENKRQGEPVGVPIAGDDKDALAIAERLIKEIGFEPVAVGGLAMGKYLNVGTPLAGVHTPDEIRKIAATLK